MDQQEFDNQTRFAIVGATLASLAILAVAMAFMVSP